MMRDDVCVTIWQVAKMKHAIGFSVGRVKRGKYSMYRNYYSAPKDDEWEGLIAMGLAEGRPSEKPECIWYRVTSAGIEFLERLMEVRIVKDE